VEIKPTQVAVVVAELELLELMPQIVPLETVELDYNQILQEPIPIMLAAVVAALGLIFLEIPLAVQVVQVVVEMVENTMIIQEHKLLVLQTQAEVEELLELQMVQQKLVEVVLLFYNLQQVEHLTAQQALQQLTQVQLVVKQF
jgi:hypothetical protein